MSTDTTFPELMPDGQDDQPNLAMYAQRAYLNTP